MSEKRLFWREFWILWAGGVIANVALAGQSRIPITPIAGVLLFKGHLPRALLSATQAIEIPLELALTVWCGLLAAQRIGLGAPLLDRWLGTDPVKVELWRLIRSSILVGILVAIASITSNLPALHPNRQLAHQEAEKIVASARSAEVGAKLAEFAGQRATFVSLAISYFSAAVSGELLWRLFVFSGVVLLFSKIANTQPAATNTLVLISAAFLVGALEAALYLAWQTAATNMVYRSIGLTRTAYEPLWALAAQALLQTIPRAVGFGFLYVRRGIESAICSAFIAAVVAHILVTFVLVRLL